eukprot:4559423-Pyramimonas_sp.AAC.3
MYKNGRESDPACTLTKEHVHGEEEEVRAQGVRGSGCAVRGEEEVGRPSFRVFKVLGLACTVRRR